MRVGLCPACGHVVAVSGGPRFYQVDDHQRPVLDARGQATGWRACARRVRLARARVRPPKGRGWHNGKQGMWPRGELAGWWQWENLLANFLEAIGNELGRDRYGRRRAWAWPPSCEWPRAGVTAGTGSSSAQVHEHTVDGKALAFVHRGDVACAGSGDYVPAHRTRYDGRPT